MTIRTTPAMAKAGRLWAFVRRGAFAGATGVALAVYFLGYSLPSHAIDDAGRAEIEGIIHDYLIENPEILREIVEALKVKEDALAVTESSSQIALNREALEGGDSAFVGGNPKGDVSLIEFFDYACGYCKRAAPDVAQLIENDQKIRVVYKEFPILGPASLFAARAAIAARRQGKYLEFHHRLISLQTTLSEGLILQTAEDIGIDVARMKEDMDRGDVQAIIDQNLEIARRLNITGTPSFVIGDQLLPGAVGYENLQAAVKAARANCSTC